VYQEGTIKIDESSVGEIQYYSGDNRAMIGKSPSSPNFFAGTLYEAAILVVTSHQLHSQPWLRRCGHIGGDRLYRLSVSPYAKTACALAAGDRGTQCAAINVLGYIEGAKGCLRTDLSVSRHCGSIILETLPLAAVNKLQ
jgi:hypothetical protein